MNFHAKSLEILSKIHGVINSTDVDADLADISNRVNLCASRSASPTNSFFGSLISHKREPSIGSYSPNVERKESRVSLKSAL